MNAFFAALLFAFGRFPISSTAVPSDYAMNEPRQETLQEQDQIGAVASIGDQRDGGAGNDDAPTCYWCYQCNKEVSAETVGDGAEDDLSSGMVCTECRSGFIEAMDTARADLDRALRRRRRRVAAQGRTVSLLDALERLYPQQLMQIFQMLDQASRSNNTRLTSQEQVSSENTLESVMRIESQTETDRLDEGQPQAESVAVEISGSIANSSQNSTDERQPRVVRERSVEQDEDAESGVDTDSGTEGVRFEFEGWDSADDEDDEEWEEVEDEEEVGGTGEDGNEIEVVDETEIEVTEETPTEGLADQRIEDQLDLQNPLVRELHNLRFRARNIEENLQRYLQSLLENIGGQNIEVLVELPDHPTYVGNPGDYVDAREFELLLQQFAENDNSRRGAPPAAKTAIDALPSVVIAQCHVVDGITVCAICKDGLGLGSSAKQLPCLHLYHQGCILPWLGSRNSCPVCRFELPTDDSDYEEQKKLRESITPRFGEALATADDQSDGEIDIAVLSREDATHVSCEASDLASSSTGDNAASTSSEVSFEQVQGKFESSTTAEQDVGLSAKER
ncbi:hypothetical protein O6H91_14G030800 [Diphasiastrum complanatum]|uniref:Uncharacterized protein n=1 Tax=Diphasiastrum complanatum TaxID=34168 RepID=A0ACC2BMT7_DIPCM|nr:hypothetical protein O6H91_14G030800 [Diphasiastrum complanatum]